MKTIGALILVIAAIVFLLRSDYLPYKLVSKQELQAIAVQTAKPVNTGSWMRDPGYRTALDKPASRSGGSRPNP